MLAPLAVRVQADPFKKVRQLIQALIVKLMEEANEEAEHKGWCDSELSTNEQTRKEKTEAVETLNAEIDEMMMMMMMMMVIRPRRPAARRAPIT